jgi:hypothetical protein
MALVRCKECRTKVSTSATACPKCGATGEAIAPQKKSPMAVIIVLVSIVVLVMIGVINGADTSGSASTDRIVQIDPAAELEAALRDDPSRWLELLATYQPERHNELIENLEERTEVLLAEVRALPASEVERNMLGYAELVAMNPNDSFFQQKYEHYKSEYDVIQQRLRAERTCAGTSMSTEAGLYAKEIVKRSLKAPRTAKFPWVVEGRHLGNCRFLVASYVDAENSFGAMIRTNYTVTLQRQGLNWQLEDIQTY